MVFVKVFQLFTSTTMIKYEIYDMCCCIGLFEYSSHESMAMPSFLCFLYTHRLPFVLWTKGFNKQIYDMKETSCAHVSHFLKDITCISFPVALIWGHGGGLMPPPMLTKTGEDDYMLQVTCDLSTYTCKYLYETGKSLNGTLWSVTVTYQSWILFCVKVLKLICTSLARRD